MFSDFFLGAQDSSQWVIEYSYVYWLVAVSYIVAAFASFTAFQLIERVVAATNTKTKFSWVMIGAVSMGCGIWAMHFVAMMAVEMKMQGEVGYSVGLTILSAVFAILASGFAFWFVAKGSHTLVRLLPAGVILGAGIGAMHYTGMAAMQMDAVIKYDPLWFGASIVIAVLLSTVALRLMYFNIEVRDNEKLDQRMITATVMGLAVTLMHYAGMAATYFIRTDAPTGAANAGMTLHGPMMGLVIGMVAIAILCLAWFAADADQRKEHHKAQLTRAEQ